MLTTHQRLVDPLIASVIFAPAASNYALSSVTASADKGEAMAFEWMVAQDDDTMEQILRSRWRDLEEVKRFVAALCGQLEFGTAAGYGSAVTTSPAALPQVPSRNFPFMGHFNLLALPVVEGMNFDADDFVER
ncbi:MAG TPA: hypothetical protein VKM93_28465 [Terriglobia bacterium]|nr:hypothetical protein [Terriglobia bacterium]